MKTKTVRGPSPNRPDLRVIACNVTSGNPTYSPGSLAFISQLAGDRARLLVHSRGGRWVRKWIPIIQLANFRFKLLPPEHPLFERIGDVGSAEFFSDDDLASLATRGAGQNLPLR